ncbi:MAG TPA: RNA 2',3'-cyclic phosphodiesterase [Gemmatimonadales bacterium]|nr:RNA 2',3'-cyclic phosphodiesterase [Gemmatimonadales bacterium]
MRLFIAVNLPSEVRRALWDAVEPARRPDPPVRWVQPDGLHLTLKFLGDVDAGRDPDIRAGLQAATHLARPFTVHLTGFGVFPNASRPRVFWAGCEPVPALEVLQHRVEQEMDRLGFPLEGRPFRPHLTVGRARDGAPPGRLAAAADQLMTLTYASEVLVTAVDLMESQLTPSGARYACRHTVSLGI